jgi:hypothetical protein
MLYHCHQELTKCGTASTCMSYAFQWLILAQHDHCSSHTRTGLELHAFVAHHQTAQAPCLESSHHIVEHLICFT